MFTFKKLGLEYKWDTLIMLEILKKQFYLFIEQTTTNFGEYWKYVYNYFIEKVLALSYS